MLIITRFWYNVMVIHMLVLPIPAQYLYPLIILFIEFYALLWLQPLFCFPVLMSCLLLIVYELYFNNAIFSPGNVCQEGSKNTRHPFLFHIDPMYISTYQMPVVPGHILRSLLWRGGVLESILCGWASSTDTLLLTTDSYVSSF